MYCRSELWIQWKKYFAGMGILKNVRQEYFSRSIQKTLPLFRKPAVKSNRARCEGADDFPAVRERRQMKGRTDG